MGERGVRNAEVRGSIPLISTHPPKIIVYIGLSAHRPVFTKQLGNNRLNSSAGNCI